jgi:hypothetical protein
MTFKKSTTKKLTSGRKKTMIWETSNSLSQRFKRKFGNIMREKLSPIQYTFVK